MALDDDALTRALLMAGFGMMGAQTPWQGLSRGGMFGLQGYDQAIENKRKASDDDMAQQMKALQKQQLQQSIDKQAKLAALYGGGQAGTPMQAPQGPRPSMMDAPDWTSNPLAQRPQQAPQGGKSVGQMLLDAGFVKEADDWAKAQTALGGEVFNEVHVGKDGRPYLLNKNGKQQYLDSSAAPRDELVTDNIGGALKYRTKYDMKSLGTQDVGMSPDAVAADKRGWADIGLQREKFNRGDLREFPTASGGTGLGYVTPGGVQQVPGTGEKEKERPAAIQMALAQNNVALAKIDNTLALLDARPGSVGIKNAAPFADAIRQRTDPEGVDLRAGISDAGSLKIHDRSGANVTANEAPRLKPFVPDVSDTPDAIRKKLVRFRQEYAQMQQELSGGKALSDVVVSRKVATENVPSGAAVEAELRRRGIKPGGF